MKSRTSFFDKTVFRKNLTRFAPVWGLYTLCLMLALMLMAESGLEYWLPANLAESLQVMPVINCGYALIVAQMLFGDLFNTRMCNALHALPIRRESWFVTNTVSGLVFSLGPTLVMTIAALALAGMSEVPDAGQIPLLWLLGVNLQYLFFFGTAVLCVFCTGNRFAMALVYAILNLGANVVYWLVDTIYVPMLYGIQTQYEKFLPFFPMGQMVEMPLISMDHGYEIDSANLYWPRYGFALTENWWYLWVCAGLGLVFLAGALLLYRRRKLERAGDFMAVKALEPVFLVLYTLVAAAMFQVVYQVLFNNEGYLFLAIGLSVGFFTGRMLLERRVNVFRWKNWVALGALGVAVGLSLLLVRLDLFGVESWMPKADNVEKVVLSLGYEYNYSSSSLTLTAEEDIEKVLYVHEQALIDKAGEDVEVVEVITCPAGPVETDQLLETVSKIPVTITIRYEMKNGATVRRYYNVWADDEEGRMVRDWFSSVECVAGTDDLAGKLAGVDELYIGGELIPEEYYEADIQGLAAAIEADCEAGTMAQNWNFHSGVYVWEGEDWYVDALYLDLMLGDTWTSLHIYGDSENTLAWLEAQGILDYVWENCHGLKFG